MFKSKALVATVATALALLAGAGSATAHVDAGGVPQSTGTSSIPEGMTAQQWHALVVRGEGYNRLYGLGKYAPKLQLRKLHGNADQTPSGDALAIRNVLDESRSRAVTQTQLRNPPYGIPQGMTAENLMSPATRAALLRGEAMNARYGNAWTKLSAREYGAIVRLFGSGVTSYSPQQLRTLLARAESVGTSSTATVATSGSDGFSWGDAGIGGLGAIGIALVCAVAAFFYHRGRGPESSFGEAHGTV